jgi:hypothetical protein
MWRACVIVASVCLVGCHAPYRSASGTIYGPDAEDLDVLRDSGSTSLKCDRSQVKVRRFITGNYYQTILVADGCGQRATFLTDCSRHARGAAPGSPPIPRCPAGDAGPANGSCARSSNDVMHTCDLVLISKVALE